MVVKLSIVVDWICLGFRF